MTRDEKIARIQQLVDQNPPSGDEIDAALDSVLAELEGGMQGTEQPAKIGLIGAAVIGGLIVHVLKK